MVDGRRAANVMLQLMRKFGLEFRIIPGKLILSTQLIQCGNQRLGDKDSPIRTEMAVPVGKIINFHWLELLA
jgi:hypothetical protein